MPNDCAEKAGGSAVESGREQVRALASTLRMFGKSGRAAMDSAAAFGGADTTDLLTEVSRGVGTLLWKEEAHAPAKG